MSKRNTVMSNEARTALEQSTNGDHKGLPILCLPPTQLGRKVYVEVADLIERAGGKWNKGAKGFTFADKEPGFVPTASILGVIEQHDEAGFLPHINVLDFFATPPPLAERMIELAKFGDGSLKDPCRVLEPSAGEGALIDAVYDDGWNSSWLRFHTVEEDDNRFATLCRKYGDFTAVRLEKGDFLSIQFYFGEQYNRVLMNPPFTSPDDPNAYIAHIRKAYSLLAPGGILVSVAPSGLEFRDTKTIREFREFIENAASGEILPVDSGAFKEAGTGVEVCLVVMHKPETVSA